MTSYNKAILAGNLTSDVDLKSTPNGKSVTEVTLAVNHRRKNASGEWIDEPVFVDVTLWGRQAEVAAEHLSKGSSVLFDGRFKYDTWETDGQKRSKLSVVAESMQMLPKGKASCNDLVLVGNLTRDIELKYLQSGTAVCEIGLAVNNRKKDADGKWVDEPVFFDVTLWGRNAEVANEYLAKGASVLVNGRLKLDTWETEGQKRSKLRVVGERFQMLGSKGSTAPAPAEGELVAAGAPEDDDVPF